MTQPRGFDESPEREVPAAAPAVARVDGTAAGAWSPARVLALQRSAGNAAVMRMIARAPAPPPKLKRDPGQVKINPVGNAVAPIEYAAIADEGTSFKDRRFAYTSVPSNLTLTWRWFDGSDTEAGSSSQVLAELAFSPDIIRDRVRSKGRSALGTWTIRLEKDDYYDDVTFEVREERPLGAMDGKTTQSWFNLRDLPGGDILGTLSGDSVPISVDGKAKAGGEVYYHVTLKAATGLQKGGSTPFPAGTKAWMSGQAIVPVTGWDMFRAQLSSWEKANLGLTLADRITRLRQMTHKSNLPFDKVIGTSSAPSGTYLDDRAFQPGDWDILNDSQMVRMPDGKVIEVQHLLVGLDVLPRMKENHSFREWGVKVEVGQNYSAATWAGDVGAGAADAAIKFDKEWEAHNPGAKVADRTTRYYTTRLPLEELTGDIDAWGIDEARNAPGAPTTIEGLLADYYGAPAVPDAGGAPAVHSSKRKGAIERFLRHYGFSYPAGGSLKAQAAPREAMKKQIVMFGKTWLDFRPGSVTDPITADMQFFAGAMVEILLDDIETLARQAGAST